MVGKKKKVPAKAQAPRGGGQGAKPNPFELKGTKRKFDVLGRREKTGKKNIIQSREDAVTKRKKTLLVEYKQLRKSNTFIDRRFGEDDPRLDEEDRALARFQAQRVREARREAKFSLADGDDGGGLDGATLTHGGRSLDDLEDLSGRPDALADLDEAEIADLERQLHFGGGGGDGGEGDGGGDGEGRRRSRKEIMEEIIAKSKAFKAAKQKQKDEDEQQLERLDAAFKELVGAPSSRGGGGAGAGAAAAVAAAAAAAAAARAGTGRGGALAGLLKPPGFDKGVKVAPSDPDDAAYDRAARELVFEAKGQAGERTLTPEELQERERLRLEALEKQRVKRMRADAGSGDDEDGGGAEGGGFAARRRKLQHRSGDALDDDFASSGDDEDADEDADEDEEADDVEDGGDPLLSALDARRRERAAGGHPLQAAFREQAARLAAKYGVEVEGAEDGSGSGSEEDEDEDQEGEGEEGGSGSEDEEEEGEEAGDSGSSEGGGSEEEGEEGRSGSEEEDEHEEGAAAAAAAAEARRESGKAAGTSSAKPAPGKGRAAASAAAAVEGPLDLPFTIPVPQRYEQFAALVAGRPAGELALAISRIRAFNAAALATDNKRQLQVLYGTLLQHFAMIAGDAPTPVASLDVLTQALLAATQEVPFYATTAARARLGRMQEQLSAALKDPLSAPRAGWPGARQLLQLRLFSLLFPVSDKRHAVATPLALLLGRYLAQCPVPGPQEAAVGLLVAGLALQAAAPAGRAVPEAVAFVAAALGAFRPAAEGEKQQQKQEVASLFAPGCLAFSQEAREAAAAGPATNGKAAKKGGKKGGGKGGGDGGSGGAAAAGAGAEELPPLQLYSLLSLQPGAAECKEDGFKLRLLGCCVATARASARAAAMHFPAAAPPLLRPLLSAAEGLLAPGALPRGGAAAAAVAALLEELRGVVAAAEAARAPLVQPARAKARVIKEYTPRFEEGFHSKGDYDHDRARADRKKLQREVVREKRGAMRELRRDATFMAQARRRGQGLRERDAERARVDSERLASERRFYSELQAQEADFKQGGQKGMHKGRKKAAK